MEEDMAPEQSGSLSVDERPLLTEYSRAKRFNLNGASQQLIASYMCSNQTSVAEDESQKRRWKPGLIWHLRRAIANALLEIKVPEDKSMEFWHEVNKYWVAAGYSVPLVPDELSYEQILAEVYAEIVKAKQKPDYQKYESGRQRMRENRGRQPM
jgi:hypothetical protein